MDLNTINIISSVASLVVSVGAVALAIVFYMGGRNTELRVSTALAEIKAQTDALQKLSGRQIDKLMKHAFEATKSEPSTEITHQLLLILKDMPYALTSSVDKTHKESYDEQFIITLYIVLYFYTAQTNYWAQFYLPSSGEFDINDQFHQLVKRIVDSSCDDFGHAAKFLSTVDVNKLKSNSLVNLLDETKDNWRYSVKSTADIFIQKEHQ